MQELKAGRRVYLAFVVEQEKGSPGTTAARMLVRESGERIGTIGGGIMERRVLDSANDLLKSDAGCPPRVRQFDHKAGGGESPSGLICGGSQTNVEMVLLPGDSTDLVARICESAVVGRDSIVIESKGLRLISSAEEADLPEGLTQSDSGAWLVRLSLLNTRRVVVFGGGHCGVALANTMHRLDYAVSLVEPRKGVKTLNSLYPGIEHIAEPFETASASIGHCPATIAIVMTFSMGTDIEALSGILGSDFQWVGLMGSEVKIARIRRSLRSKGFSDLQISRITAPIGLDFNTDTPEEIAVSIAAQILLNREAVE